MNSNYHIQKATCFHPELDSGSVEKHTFYNLFFGARLSTLQIPDQVRNDNMLNQNSINQIS